MGRPDGPPYQPPVQQASSAPPPYPSPQYQGAQYPAGAVGYSTRDEREPSGEQDIVDGRIYHQTTSSTTSTYHHSSSTVDQVANDIPDIVRSFIRDRMTDDGIPIPDALAMQTQLRVNSDVAHCLRQIGDDLNNNTSLNALINQITVSKDTAFGTFASVAGQIFADGNINWGRIVALLYFGYKLAVKVISQGLIQTIVGWVVKFITERLATWIARRGGWTSIREYFGATSKQTVVVFIAGALAGALVYWMNSK